MIIIIIQIIIIHIIIIHIIIIHIIHIIIIIHIIHISMILISFSQRWDTQLDGAWGAHNAYVELQRLLVQQRVAPEQHLRELRVQPLVQVRQPRDLRQRPQRVDAHAAAELPRARGEEGGAGVPVGLGGLLLLEEPLGAVLEVADDEAEGGLEVGVGGEQLGQVGEDEEQAVEALVAARLGVVQLEEVRERGGVVLLEHHAALPPGALLAAQAPHARPPDPAVHRGLGVARADGVRRVRLVVAEEPAALRHRPARHAVERRRRGMFIGRWA